MTESTPAGWYPDPENAGGSRYWDGAQWTEHRSAGAPGAPPPPSAGGMGQPSYGQGAYGQPAQKIDPWLWQSIVATLFCCLPFGVVGIVFAAQANSAMGAGDFATAQQKAGQARTWTLVSAGVGVVVLIAYFAFFAAALSTGDFS